MHITESSETSNLLIPGCYVSPSPVLDVMQEQLQYLFTHAVHCAPRCPDCARLEQMKECLLQAFC
jgi:hypothetical protein